VALIGFWKAARVFDRAVVALLLVGALAGIWWSLHHVAGDELVVEHNGDVVYVAPLNEEKRVVIPGELGPTILHVAAGEAWVAAASCPGKICMRMGKIHRQGDVVACLPNRLLLRIRGEDREAAYDFITE